MPNSLPRKSTIRTYSLSLATALLLAPSLPGTAGAATPTWPGDASWTALRQGTAALIDIVGDGPADSREVVEAMSPSAYVYSDATHLFFRMRVDSTPLADPTTFLPLSWGCVVETDSTLTTFEYGAWVMGGSASVEAGSNPYTGWPNYPSDPPEVVFASDAAADHARGVVADTTANGNPDYFVDWAIDRATAASNGFDVASSFRLVCGSGDSTFYARIDADCAGWVGTCPLASVWSNPVRCDDSGCSVCGDGVVGSLEDCDDGNAEGGDGCGADCTAEPGCDVLPDGTPCNDNNACTQVDTCQGGTCVGASPVFCTPADQCHSPGTCNPATGTCSNPSRPDGTPCSDGNACTQVDTCQGGGCLGGGVVSCVAPDECHYAPSCDPGTGTCGTAPLADGAPCNDGDACTFYDSCYGGSCQNGYPIVCGAIDQCHSVGTCDSGTGLCSNPEKADATPCDDGNVCTGPDVCTGGTCTGATLSCDDGSSCTEDTCDAGTGCTHHPAVIADCRTSLASKLGYSKGSTPGKDKFKWTWSKGATTSTAEFGDPTDSAAYQLCIFSVAASEASVLIEATVPASSTLWAPISDKGYKYGDRDALSDGVSKAMLKSSASDKSKILVAGKGANLSDDVLPLDPTLIGILVQLSGGDSGLCWESQFLASTIEHDATKLAAKAGPPALPPCVNGVKDGDETAIDCGGSCSNCADGSTCLVDDDCSDDSICDSGVCGPLVCAPGTDNCDSDPGNGCETNLLTATMHCGSCTSPCPPGLQCMGGSCAPGDGCSNLIKDGDETDFDCGGSCPDCPDGAFCSLAADCTSGVCSSGICQSFSCSPGTGNCDSNPGNGCEADTTAIPNCGGCGNACVLPHVAISKCISGGCEISTCDPGYDSCDGLPATGCESNLDFDKNNCGTCGNVCASGICSSGTCAL